MPLLGPVARTVRLGQVMRKPDQIDFLDTISVLLSNRWYWVVQALLVTCAAASGWFLARASADPPGPQLPRYSSPIPPVQSYGSTPVPARTHAAQISALQAQVRAGNSNIYALEEKVGALTASLKRAEASKAQLEILREEVRNSESIISSLDSKVVALRARKSMRADSSQLESLREAARTKDQVISDTEAQVSRTTAALKRAEADAARLSALWTDARGSDAIIYSLDSKVHLPYFTAMYTH